MVTIKELDAMAQEGITKREYGTLPDLSDVSIKGNTPAQRLESFLSQVGNPYCFRVGNTPVKVVFSGENELEDILKKHFLSLKSNDFHW